MDEINLSRLNCAVQTVAFCELPASVTATAGIANFAPQVAVVKGKIVIVQSYNQIGDAATSGVTLNVIAIRESMMHHTYLLGSAVFSYAASLPVPDNNLMALSKLTASSLENMKKQNCATECDRIRQLAAAHALAIVPFGASATDITDTATLVTLYMTGIDDPRTALITRYNAKRQAIINLDDIMFNQLELKLDTMANTLRFTNPEWWSQYRAAREIIDPAIFTTVLKIKVLNKANNDPLINVKCYRDNAINFKKSSKKGFITFKDIEQGAHSFVLKLKKFQDFTISSVMISHGKKHEVIAEMIPLGTSGITLIREGSVPVGTIVDMDVVGINPTDATMVIIEINGNQLTFSATENAGGGMGPVTWTAPIGISPEKTIAQFGMLIGADDTHQFIKVQNQGPDPGHYKITFTNLA